MPNECCIYLRKSRTDIEAESRGEGESLARHQAQLLELAKRQQLTIGAIYKELVSGETIAARPVMQQLLEEVNQGRWEGVLCMEIERLARGDTMDQGLVSQSFKFSNTKIITPVKTYDPNNEFDEEYFEFNLFMSRREYKAIRRRMQAGRMASVKEGNYIGSLPPYGYKKVRDYENKAFTLEPIESEAETVKLIYELFTQKDMGYSKIATYLNRLGIPPKRTDSWSASSVKDIIGNPVYCGKLRWDRRKSKKTMSDGKIIVSRPKSEGVIYDGNHPAIIDEELWEKAQAIPNKNPHSGVHFQKPLKNYYTGLLYCKLCGHAMSRRPYIDKQAHYICNHKSCSCMSSVESEIDDALIYELKRQLNEYKIILEKGELYEQNNASDIIEKNITSEIEKLNKQQNKLYNLLEQEVYTVEIFVQRSAEISKKLEELKKIEAEGIQNKRYDVPIKDRIMIIETVLREFYNIELAEEKNTLLKTTIKKIEYEKTEGGRFNNSNLKLYVKYNF